ncbi:hypothetical protein L7F22_035706 [Adiantum nelumboides]|nr:hypothetical protein [Adiantum nelumboides]
MQQYEEILNLLFEELRDVYNFQTPSTSSTFTPADNEQSTTSTSKDKDKNVTKVAATSKGEESIHSDFNGDDAQLIQDFCLQNLNHRPTDNSGKVVPVVLPKRAKQSNNTISSEELREGMLDGCGSSDIANINPSRGRVEGQPVYNRGQTLERT